MSSKSLWVNRAIIFAVLIWILPCYGDSPVKRGTEDWRKLNQLVLDGFKKQSFLKLNRTTQQGKILSCELEFQGAFSDARYEVGEAIFVSGNLSLFYFKKRPPTYGLKLRAMRINDNYNTEQPLTNISLEFIGFLIGNKDFEKYRSKLPNNELDAGYLLAAYSDSDLAISYEIAMQELKSIKILFTPQRGGFDLSFAPSSFSTFEGLLLTSGEFAQCTNDVLSALGAEME